MVIWVEDASLFAPETEQGDYPVIRFPKTVAIEYIRNILNGCNRQRANCTESELQILGSGISRWAIQLALTGLHLRKSENIVADPGLEALIIPELPVPYELTSMSKPHAYDVHIRTLQTATVG
jgi:hypothetical protein